MTDHPNIVERPRNFKTGIIADGPRKGQYLSGIEVPRGFAMRTSKPSTPLDDLEAVFSKRTVMGRTERTLFALWIAHTYIFDRGYEYTGRLFVTSTHPSHGKSAVLRLVAKLSDDGAKKESGTTTASIRDYRKGGGRTLCLDQLDGTGKLDTEERRLLNLICSSAEVNAEIDTKDKGKGGKWITTTAPIGFPIALGKIGLLDDAALLSRSFVVWMQPETEEERAQQMPERMKPLDHDAIRLKLRQWLKSVKVEYIKAPPGTPSRVEDIWQPLLAVAKKAGGDWLQRAYEAMEALHGPDDHRDSREMKLLRRVIDECRKLPKGKGITAAELDHRLAISDHTNPSRVQRGIWLASFGLKSRRLTYSAKGGPQVPGYVFEDVWEVAKRHRVSGVSQVSGVLRDGVGEGDETP